MPKVMVLDGCHQCRSSEFKEALVVDIVTDGIFSDFHGIFDLVVHPVRTGSNDEEMEKDVKTQIFFILAKELVWLKQISIISKVRCNAIFYFLSNYWLIVNPFCFLGIYV